MKIHFKKVIGTLCTVGMLFSSAGTALSANAATLYGDVNGDGVVRQNDLLTLLQYQTGMLSSNSINLKNADVDKNAVIDVNDQKILSKSLTGALGSSLPYSESGITFNYNSYTMPSDEERGYVKYDCDSGKIIGDVSGNKSSYTLSLPESSSSVVSPFAGNIDDRVLDSSDNAQCIVRLRFKKSDDDEGTWRGTGFIVGDGVIATCAHCLYDHDNEKFNTDYTIMVYNTAGTVKIAEYRAKELHIPKEYYKNKNSDYDYGLIFVNADLSAYGTMALGLPTDQFKQTAQTISVSGFPTTVQGNGNDKRYVGSGKVRTETNDYTVWYTTYASGGDSGGPVFMEYTLKGETFRSVVAIHTGSTTDKIKHLGIRITLPVLRFFYNNPNIG